MGKVALDIYDDMPRHMKRYISNYGWHFNKAAYEYAVNLLKDRGGNKVIPYSKEKLDILLNNYGIRLDNNELYDYIYIATLGKSLYLNSSIKDEKTLLMFVKDSIDSSNYSDGSIFRMWLAAMVGKGKPIEWEDIC